MMVDRRTTLAGLMGSAALTTVAARAAMPGHPAILVIDSRHAISRALGLRTPGAHVIDIAAAHENFWAEVRGCRPRGAGVRGLTGWSDWVLLRGALQDKGLRVRAETPIDPARTSHAALFLWHMA